MGGDGLAARVCEELLDRHRHRVAVVWRHDEKLAARLAAAGERCRYIFSAPDDDAALRHAGAADAAAIMVLSDDDRLNLQVALKAREINPEIRIVMRQFNRTLGVKLEEKLTKCSVLSLASHSAAAFAAAALDPGCFGALRFPDPEGVLAAFATRTASELRVAGLAASAAQHQLCARVVALNGSCNFPRSHRFADDDEVTVFASIGRLAAAHVHGPAARAVRRDGRRAPFRTAVVRFRTRIMGWLRSLWVAYRVSILVATGAAIVFMLAVVYFAAALNLDYVKAFYFVATTFTSTGYGDITPLQPGGTRIGSPSPAAMIWSGLLMFTGVTVIGIFIAFATSALTRAQITALQGLRRIRTRGHVLVFGCGNVGTRVVEYLLSLGRRVVVVELKPDPALVKMSNRGGIELVTGDATRDATLDLCNISQARAAIAATDSDTANLEIALGVLARNDAVPVVMRVQEPLFAKSIEKNFEGISTYSASALAAPVFAMISSHPKTRGRIELGDEIYSLAERVEVQETQPPPPEKSIPLCAWRNGAFHHIDVFTDAEPHDRILYLVPLSQFNVHRPGSEEAVAAGTT